MGQGLIVQVPCPKLMAWPSIEVIGLVRIRQGNKPQGKMPTLGMEQGGIASKRESEQGMHIACAGQNI